MTLDQPLPRIAIVGAGTRLLTHDSIGPRVLEAIDGRFGANVALFNVGNTGLSLLDFLDSQDLMIIVDACALGSPPGQIHQLKLDSSCYPTLPTGTHQIGPLETLSIATLLFPEKMPKRLMAVLVETEGLAPDAMGEACKRAVAVIDNEIYAYEPAPP